MPIQDLNILALKVRKKFKRSDLLLFVQAGPRSLAERLKIKRRFLIWKETFRQEQGLKQFFFTLNFFFFLSCFLSDKLGRRSFSCCLRNTFCLYFSHFIDYRDLSWSAWVYHGLVKVLLETVCLEERVENLSVVFLELVFETTCWISGWSGDGDLSHVFHTFSLADEDLSLELFSHLL